MLQKFGLVLFLFVVSCSFGILSPHFLTWENLTNILIQGAAPAISATGMTLVIATSGIDLSMGSVSALSSILMASIMKKGYGTLFGVSSGLFLGAFLGSLNGMAVGILKVSPFIVTLGTAGIFRAVALIFTESRPIYGMPLSFRWIGVGQVLKFPISTAIAFVVATLCHVILRWTGLGVNARALGDNPNATFRMGTSIRTVFVLIYALCGLMAAISGVIVTARLNTAEAISGLGMELEAIAAAVIGGTNLTGGQASVLGTLLGSFVITLLGNGLTMANVPSYYQQLVVGIVFILAVVSANFRAAVLKKIKE